MIEMSETQLSRESQMLSYGVFLLDLQVYFHLQAQNCDFPNQGPAQGEQKNISLIDLA